MDRRSFLHGSLMLSMLSALPRPSQASLRKMLRSGPLSAQPQNPISLTNQVASLDFNGDDITRPHDILWNKEGYIAKKGGVPAITETVPLVIVGGGVAGLTAAYQLRDLKPVLLEGAPQFGGNSKGEKIGESVFSTGAAYLVKPDEGSDVQTFLHELGLSSSLREESGDETSVLYKGEFQSPFWQGTTDLKSANDFQKVHQVFRQILEEKYPDIPLLDESAISKEEFASWDNQSFAQWLKTEFGALHPHVEEYLQLYCWSSFCGSMSEVSAAQALNFITSETDAILALPGGNAAITEQIYQKLEKENGRETLRGNCFVIDITANDQGVRVIYEDGEGQIKALQAKTCVFAAPKFVAAKVITGLSEERIKIIESFNYRAYVVANILLKEKVKSPTYELYCLKGQVPEEPLAMSPSDRQFTDVCFGSWAAEPNTDRGVITVYKSLPYEGARQFLFSPFAHDKNKKQIQSQIPNVLNAMGLTESDIDGIRMTRWGHAVPLAEVGALASGNADRASETFENRIVFANQDNWLNPAFESSFAAGQEAAEKIRNLLR